MTLSLILAKALIIFSIFCPSEDTAFCVHDSSNQWHTLKWSWKICCFSSVCAGKGFSSWNDNAIREFRLVLHYACVPPKRSNMNYLGWCFFIDNSRWALQHCGWHKSPHHPHIRSFRFTSLQTFIHLVAYWCSQLLGRIFLVVLYKLVQH